MRHWDSTKWPLWLLIVMLTWTHSIRVQAQEVNGSGPTGLLDTSLFDLDTDHDSDDDDGEAASSSFFNPWFDNLRSLIAREEEKKRNRVSTPAGSSTETKTTASDVTPEVAGETLTSAQAQPLIGKRVTRRPLPSSEPRVILRSQLGENDFLGATSVNRRKNRPTPFSKIKSGEPLPSFSSTFLSTIPEAETTIDPLLTTESTIRSPTPMDIAREQIRAELAKTPRTLTPLDLAREEVRETLTTTEPPTTTSSPVVTTTITTTTTTTPTTTTPPGPMATARNKIREKMAAEREALEKVIAAKSTTKMIKVKRKKQKESSPSSINTITDPMISVTVRGNTGDVNPAFMLGPAITFEPSLEFVSTTTTLPVNDNELQLTSTADPLASVHPTQADLVELLEARTEPDADDFNVLNVPNRMQNTLIKLLSDKAKTHEALREPILVNSEEEFRDLATKDKAILQALSGDRDDPIETKDLQEGNEGLVPLDKDFDDFEAPSPSQNPFVSKVLESSNQGLIPTKEDFVDVKPPSQRQDPIVTKILQPANEGLISKDDSFTDVQPPSSRQDPLATRPLQSNDDGNASDSLPLPRERQNPLLKPLQSNDDGFVDRRKTFSDFRPPRRNQNPLLRQLKKSHSGFVDSRKSFSDFKPPSRSHRLLIRNRLKGQDEGHVEGLRVPSRRQNTLLKNLSGGRNDPIVGLELPEEIDDEVETFQFDDEPVKVESLPLELADDDERSNPLLGELQGGHTSQEDDLEPPSEKQNTLLRLLQEGHTSADVDLDVPSVRQSTLLRPLTGGQSGEDHEINVPSEKQNTLLRPLTPGQSGSDHELDVPSLKQDTLLRPLTSGQSSNYELPVPSEKQNTLLRPLTAGLTGSDHDIEVPSDKQSPLLSPLTSGFSGANHDIEAPSEKQSPLLRTLQAGHTASDHDLDVPSLRQDTLLKQLRSGHDGVVPDLEVPSRKQSALLKLLKAKQSGSEHDLEVPSLKQDSLLKVLRPGHSGSDHDLNPPPAEEVSFTTARPDFELVTNSNLEPEDELQDLEDLQEERDPLQRPLSPKTTFDANKLDLPSLRQNPLLKILRYDRREKQLRNGLTPPNFKVVPVFRQVMKMPQKFQQDFLQLPRRMKENLKSILILNAGPNFDIDALTSGDDSANLELPPAQTTSLPIFSTTAPSEIIGTTFSQIFPTAFPPRPSTAGSQRPRFRMPPRNKFEILKVHRPVDEVTFERVSSATESQVSDDVASPTSSSVFTKSIAFSIPSTTTLKSVEHDEETELPPVLGSRRRPKMKSVEEILAEMRARKNLLLQPEATTLPTTAQAPTTSTQTESTLPQTALPSEILGSTSGIQRIETTITSTTSTTTTSTTTTTTTSTTTTTTTTTTTSTTTTTTTTSTSTTPVPTTTTSPLVIQSLAPLILGVATEHYSDPETSTFDTEAITSTTFAPDFDFQFLPTTEGQGEVETTTIGGDSFNDEVKEVIATLRDNHIDIPTDEAKNMLDNLMLKAKIMSKTEEEQRENVEMVDSLVRMFMRSNSEKAKQRFRDRQSDKPNPVRVINDQIRNQLSESPEESLESDTNMIGPPFHASDSPAFVKVPPPMESSTTTLSPPELEELRITHDFGLRASTERIAPETVPSIPRSTTLGASAAELDTSTESTAKTSDEGKSAVIRMRPKKKNLASQSLQSQEVEEVKDVDDEITPQIPHRYHDPPASVRGQLLRLWNQGTPVKVRTPEPQPQSPRTTQRPSKMPQDVLRAMLRLMDEGRISHEDVVEEMINRGVLPVEVTDIGKIPITVGVQKESLVGPNDEDIFVDSAEREAVAPFRVRELTKTRRRPTPVSRDRPRRPDLEHVDITDPDGDFEYMNEKQETTQSLNSDPVDNGKDIDVKNSMLNLFKHGMISRQELNEMMAVLDMEASDIEAADADNAFGVKQEGEQETGDDEPELDSVGDTPNESDAEVQSEQQPNPAPAYASFYDYEGVNYGNFPGAGRPVEVGNPDIPLRLPLPKRLFGHPLKPQALPLTDTRGRKPVSHSYIKIDMGNPKQKQVFKPRKPVTSTVDHDLPTARKPSIEPQPVVGSLLESAINARTPSKSVQEFSSALTREKLQDSFEDLFNSFDIAGHGFMPKSDDSFDQSHGFFRSQAPDPVQDPTSPRHHHNIEHPGAHLFKNTYVRDMVHGLKDRSLSVEAEGRSRPPVEASHTAREEKAYDFDSFMPEHSQSILTDMSYHHDPLPANIFDFDDRTHEAFKSQPPFQVPSSLLNPAQDRSFGGSGQAKAKAKAKVTVPSGSGVGGDRYPFSRLAFTGHFGIDSKFDKIAQSFLQNEKENSFLSDY